MVFPGFLSLLRAVGRILDKMGLSAGLIEEFGKGFLKDHISAFTAPDGSHSLVCLSFPQGERRSD